jgi:hypothetical protein
MAEFIAALLASHIYENVAVHTMSEIGSIVGGLRDPVVMTIRRVTRRERSAATQVGQPLRNTITATTKRSYSKPVAVLPMSQPTP